MWPADFLNNQDKPETEWKNLKLAFVTNPDAVGVGAWFTLPRFTRPLGAVEPYWTVPKPHFGPMAIIIGWFRLVGTWS